MKPISTVVEQMKPSGIRKFFDLASTMDDVISLGVGEPDFATPWHICQAAMQSLADGKTHYTANRGLLELREEIAKFHHEHYDQNYDPKTEIVVTVGGSEGIDISMRALLNPGDEVIVMDPNYVAYEPAVALAGGVCVPIVLTKENEFKLIVLAITDILNSNSEIIALGDNATEIIEKAFNKKLENNRVLLEGVVSRKKQILPNIDKNI